ncbi:MAG: hypothetical protein K0M63_06050 [Weeksellaceae bacterium]|nr:hypothetical protein [Weeksellaceae bacterium]
MKNIVISLVCLVVLLFCSSSNKDDTVVGTYHSPESSTLNKLRYGMFALGLKLELKKDSTYFYSTCAQTSNGKWSVRKNNLILKCKEIRFINDSINQIERFSKGKICGGDLVFEIQDKKLIRLEKLQNGKEGKFILLKN